MFKFFRQNPVSEAARELDTMMQIPCELIAVTCDTFGSVGDVLAQAGVNTRLNEQALFEEICAYHVKTVIVTMNRIWGVVGGSFAPGTDDAFDTGARFLVKSVRGIMDQARSRGVVQPEMMKTLTSDKTMQMAAAYYLGKGLGVSEDDVLEFGRKYNPRLLSLSRDDRAHSGLAYIIRAICVSQVEDLLPKETRGAAVAGLNNLLCRAASELESKVERLAPKA